MDLGRHQEHYSEVFTDYTSILLFLKEASLSRGDKKGQRNKTKNGVGGVICSHTRAPEHHVYLSY